MEDTHVGRGWASLIVVGILLASAGGAALLIWQARVHNVPLNYVIGALLVVIGVGFSVLHLSVNDEYLRQHFGGEENATRVRKMWRGGWVGALLGVAMIAAQYLLGGGP
jgi:drug/metabolite transporter (DMT)-like permease